MLSKLIEIPRRMAWWAARHPPAHIFAVAFALRLALIAYGQWQDQTSKHSHAHLDATPPIQTSKQVMI